MVSGARPAAAGDLVRCEHGGELGARLLGRSLLLGRRGGLDVCGRSVPALVIGSVSTAALAVGAGEDAGNHVERRREAALEVTVTMVGVTAGGRAVPPPGQGEQAEHDDQRDQQERERVRDRPAERAEHSGGGEDAARGQPDRGPGAAGRGRSRLEIIDWPVTSIGTVSQSAR